jgi:hypothetical protein
MLLLQLFQRTESPLKRGIEMMAYPRLLVCECFSRIKKANRNVKENPLKAKSRIRF